MNDREAGRGEGGNRGMQGSVVSKRHKLMIAAQRHEERARN